jgi:hypothetical protein
MNQCHSCTHFRQAIPASLAGPAEDPLCTAFDQLALEQLDGKVADLLITWLTTLAGRLSYLNNCPFHCQPRRSILDLKTANSNGNGNEPATGHPPRLHDGK